MYILINHADMKTIIETVDVDIIHNFNSLSAETDLTTAISLSNLYDNHVFIIQQ